MIAGELALESAEGSGVSSETVDDVITTLADIRGNLETVSSSLDVTDCALDELELEHGGES